MAMIKKKVMGKPMKKAQKGKKVPKYDDDANDRLMADTYADYMNDKKRGKIPLEPTIQRGIKDGTLNPDGTIKKPTKRGSESNTSRTPMKKGGVVKKKMQMGGSAESNIFTIPSKNKISIPKKASKDSSVESNVFTIPSRNKISIPKKGAMMKKGGTMKKCKYGCK